MAPLLTALALGGALALPAAVIPVADVVAPQAKPGLPPVSIDLPAGSRPLPPGPNVAVVSANCITCHSSGMILNQPNLTPATWEAEVNKMINVYKAPVDKANVPAIVSYLSAVKGG